MDVEVRFTGLCAFVRNTSLKSMRVVLVAPSATAPCDQHVPALLVPVSHWDQSINPRTPSQQFFDQDYMENVVVLPLTAEDLVFPTGSTSLSRTLPRIGSPCPGQDFHSFDWIAQIKEFIADDRMKDSILVDQSPAGVAARIRITSGQIGTQSPRMGPDKARGGFGIVNFSITNSTGTTTSRPLADELLLTDSLTSPSGIYAITSTSFTGSAKPPIMLHENSSMVRFRVIDIPLDKIINPAAALPFAPDPCFAEFYDLGMGGAGSVPVPMDTGLCEFTGGLSNPKCPCALFADNSNA